MNRPHWPFTIRVFHILGGLNDTGRYRQRRHPDQTNEASIKHYILPWLLLGSDIIRACAQVAFGL